MRPEPEPLPFDAVSFGYLYSERDRQGRQQLATYNRMMQDISNELARVKAYLDASYEPLIAGARQSVLDTLSQLGVPEDTSSRSEAEILGYISTVETLLAQASHDLTVSSSDATAFSGSDVLQLEATDIKAATLSRVPRHWRAWDAFPEAEQSLYQRSYNAALQARVTGEMIKALEERLARLKASLERAQRRDAIAAKATEVARHTSQQVTQKAEALKAHLAMLSSQTSLQVQSAKNAFQESVERLYQEIEVIISRVNKRIDPAGLAQLNETLKAQAATIVADLTSVVDRLMVDASAFMDAQQQAITQAVDGTLNRLHAQLGEATAQLQNGPAYENAEAIDQHLRQVSGGLSNEFEAHLTQPSTSGSTKSQEVLATVTAAVEAAHVQLQALPGIAQRSLAQLLNTYRFAGRAPVGLSLPGHGIVPLAETALSALRQTITQAAASLGKVATLGSGGAVTTGVAALFYSSSTASEEQDRPPSHFRFGLSIDAREIGFSADAVLPAATAAEGKVELPYRLIYDSKGDGRYHVLMVRPDGERVSKSIPIREATLDLQAGRYRVDIAMPGSTGGLPVTLTWTPARTPATSSPTTTPIVPPLRPSYAGGELEPLEINVEAYPGILPDGHDLIVTFPAEAGLDPLYIVLNDHHYYPAPNDLIAFPDARRVRAKSGVQGGGKTRRRWKDSKGRIYEWDSMHGKVEIYDKQGKHAGEFDPVSGHQTKPAKPGRKTPKSK
ncbi:MAG: pyoS3A [Pseudomonas orientalis]|nr:pyoS3A [Pseudomonas orientalis]